MTALSSLSQPTLISSPATIPTGPSEDAQTIEQQQADFLSLLTTQLQNQNPLDPLDTNEFSNQLVQFSQLEQQLEINEGVQDLNDSFSQNGASLALSYVDQSVELGTNVAPVQDGQAIWNYDVEGIAEDVFLTVTDESGNRIFEGDGDLGVGVQNFTLDTAALGIEDGTQLTLSVAASNDAVTLSSNITSKARVDGVSTNGSEPLLTAGTLAFTINDVLKVSDPQALASNSISDTVEDALDGSGV